MFLGKIIVKNDYEEKGDLVFRPLVRAYQKHGFDAFIEGNNVILLGIICNDIFYELFTWKPIPYSDYKLIDPMEFDSVLATLPLEKARMIKRTINNFVFNKIDDDFYDSSSIEELARDRAVEFEAFAMDLTDINPYQEPFNGYNDFSYKCKMLERGRRI